MELGQDSFAFGWAVLCDRVAHSAPDQFSRFRISAASAHREECRRARVNRRGCSSRRTNNDGRAMLADGDLGEIGHPGLRLPEALDLR
jgi:hypothetical protein